MKFSANRHYLWKPCESIIAGGQNGQSLEYEVVNREIRMHQAEQVLACIGHTAETATDAELALQTIRYLVRVWQQEQQDGNRK